MATSWRCVLISYFAPFKIFWLTIITDIRASSTLGPLVIFIQGRLTGCSAKSRSLSRTFLENALQERELQMYFLRLLHTPRVCPAVARHMGCLAGHRHISVMHIELNALIFRSASARSGYNSQNDEPSASSIAVCSCGSKGKWKRHTTVSVPFFFRWQFAFLPGLASKYRHRAVYGCRGPDAERNLQPHIGS